MPRGDKFIDFSKYLRNINTETVALSFEQIEKILGFRLAPSAYKYRVYWLESKTHTFPVSWLSEGFELIDLNMSTKTAIFKRCSQ